MFDVNDEDKMMVNIQTNMNSQSYVELIINSDFDNIFVASPKTGNPSRILSQRGWRHKTYIKHNVTFDLRNLEGEICIGTEMKQIG